MTQEIIEESKKYEMQHLAYANALKDLDRAYKAHKDETNEESKTIELVYPFRESLVDEVNGNYDSNTAYYSATLITLFRELESKLSWIDFKIESTKEKVYDTTKEAHEVHREKTDEDTTVVEFSKPFKLVPTITFHVYFDRDSYKESEIQEAVKKFL